MKTSTPQQPKKRDPLSICLVGPPGSAKTTLAMQFPAVCIMDCDSKMDGPEQFLRKKRTDLSYAYCPITFDDNNQPVAIEKCFDRLMDQLTLIKKEDSIKVVVIDDLTIVNEFIIRKVLATQRREVMETRDWTPFKSNAINLLVGRLRALGKHTIVICHEKEKTAPNPTKPMQEEVIGYKFNFQGAVGDEMAGYFTDVWRCHSELGVGNVQEYILKTKRTTTKDLELKNSLGLPTELKCKEGELMFEKLKPYLEGKI